MPSRHNTPNTNESGVAMITVLLVLMLMSALLVGFTTVVMSDQRYRFIDHDRSQAFYAASAGVEKLTADLGNLFLENVAPTSAQITTITGAPPNIVSPPGITYGAATQAAAIPASQLTTYHCKAPKAVTNPPKGVSGYTITYCADAAGNPTTSDDPLIVTGTGAYAGMTALQTPYQIDVTARTATGGEVHLVRTLQAVAIPVFQFGIFSDSDLSFFAGPSFSFGGRVHTNGNLWLAQGDGNTLTMTSRITAVKDVVRQYLSNGASIDDGNWTGTVNLATSAAAPTGNRDLLRTEGSVVGLPPSNVLGLPGSAPTANWQTISLGATAPAPGGFNGFLRNGPTPLPNPVQPGTGAKQLRLPLTSPGVTGCVDIAGVPVTCTNIEIIKRPRVGEDMTAILYNERLFSKASLRILLSDTAADISNLPGVTATAPVPLDGNWNVALPVVGYGPVQMSTAAGVQNRPPIALSPGPRTATTTNSVVVGASWTINFASTAAAAPFKPQFMLGASTTVISCTGMTNTTFTGCSAPLPVAGVAGTLLTTISPSWAAPTVLGANWSSFISVPTTVTAVPVFPATTTITVAAGNTTAAFHPLPFWDTGTAANPTNKLVTCTGYGATSYTGCASAVPANSLPPINNAILQTAAMSDPGIGTTGGYIKIERQNTNSTIAAPSWTDVTLEILNYGIGDINTSGVICPDPTPNAIVRIQRLRDNGGVNGGGCNYYVNGGGDAIGAKDPTNWWPNVLYDTREGLLRDANYPNPTPAYPNAYGTDFNYLTLGGVMHYVNIDVHNLSRWFKRNTAPFNVGTGNLSKVDGTGFTVYFSDRRNNRNAVVAETGEYGWEDFVNPGAANGVPNATLQTGEDVNESGTLETYGGHPNYTAPAGVPGLDTVPPCATCVATYGGPAQPASTGYVLNAAGQPNKPVWVVPGRVAEVNRAILFRRALMLSQGAWIGEDPVVADRLTGLTVVSENPVYIQGDWNANTPGGTAGFGGVNAATAVIADAVTLLSNQWSDANSFLSPYAVQAVAATAGPPATPANAGRSANTTWYRVALIAGKGMSFKLPTVGGGIPQDFGTDGGTHNFLRFLEDFTPALPAGTPTQTVHYLGSLASLYYNRQAVGTYKCCATIYNPPIRDFNFDVNFLVPALLPPNTPMFRDMNVIGFSQELRPGK